VSRGPFRLGALLQSRPTLTGGKIAVLLTLVTGAIVAVAAGPSPGATGATATIPANFQVIVNGKFIPTSKMAPISDEYIPFAPGRLKVGVRWTNDLRGSGYYVIVADIGSADRRRCLTGTSCYVVASRRLAPQQEMGWSIKILRTKGNRVLSDKTVCIVARASRLPARTAR